ncbi:DUF4139 domain-containing protein, partial [bacterium]|nr:DUF4139 domain-containing protein [bacterium]
QYVFKGLDECYRTGTDKTKELETQKNELSRWQNHVRATRDLLNRKVNCVDITLEVSQAGKYTVIVEYLIPNASWIPCYDSRLNPETGEVELKYMALVSQTTEENWFDVKLSLSTVSLRVDTFRPQLNPYNLQVINTKNRLPGSDELFKEFSMTGGITGGGNVRVHGATQTDNIYLFDGVDSTDPVTESRTFQADAEFEVPGKITVRNSNNVRRVVIKTHKLEGEIIYYCVPSIKNTAYLTARLKNTTDVPLLAGKNRLYIGSEFIGESHQEYRVQNAKFEMSFGAEERINIVYLPIESTNTDASLFRDSQKIKKAFKTRVLSLMPDPVTLIMKGRIPNSIDERIKVKNIEITPEPEKTTEKGIITWRINLKPNTEEIIKLGYQIEYPEDQRINY